MSYNSHVNDSKRSAGHGLEVGVLGSARLTENDGWWARAHKLGTLLAAEGFVLVTGGYGGLLGGGNGGGNRNGGGGVGFSFPNRGGAEHRPREGHLWGAGQNWIGP